MPYIITTNRGCDDAECNPNCRNRDWSRSAVATLEEAIDAAHVQVVAEAVDAGRAPGMDLCASAQALPESGGTVGPLPDGTVIEVARAYWWRLARDVGLSSPPAFCAAGVKRQIIDAYNAREVDRAA